MLCAPLCLSTSPRSRLTGPRETEAVQEQTGCRGQGNSQAVLRCFGCWAEPRAMPGFAIHTFGGYPSLSQRDALEIKGQKVRPYSRSPDHF